MLIRYKKSFEKIAMGLLSFMPEEKDVKKLIHTIKEYEENEDWQLYLWKENDDLLGAVGVGIDQENHSVVIQHITVNPSYRQQGIGHKMVNEIRQLYEDNHEIIANDLTESFLNKC